MPRSALHSWLLAALLWIPMWDIASADLTVRGYDPLNPGVYDRFINSPSFIGAQYDWSGVGRTNGGQWATMVSANYFISATHFAPGVDQTLTLYGSNDLLGPKQEVKIVGGQQILGTDLWLGQIDQPTNFTTYSIASPGNLTGTEVYMVGVGGGGMRLGRNTVEGYLPAFSHPNLGASVTDSVIYDYDTPTGGVGPDEAKVEGGDSGAPTFIIVNNKPVLLGIHWFQYSGGDFTNASSGSGDSLVPQYVSAINFSMGGQQVLIAAVPEPGSFALLGLPCVVCLYRRLRYSSRSQESQ